VSHDPPTPRPPGPRGWPIAGVLPKFRENPPEFLLTVARDYGDVARFHLGSQPLYLLSHPEAIKDVLVTHQSNFKKSRMLERARAFLGDGLLTSEGEFHLRQRRLVQPAFHRDRLIGYSAAMVEIAALHRDQWKPGATVDVSKEMARLTLAIVARTLFSANVSSEADEISLALAETLTLFDKVLMPFSEWIEKLRLPAFRRFEQARDRLDQTIYRMIAEHRSAGRDSGDLLSMLLLARDEETGSDPSANNVSLANNSMTDRQIRDEAMTLFLAGHETTANALTWTWYLLSQNPQAEAGLHEEIAEVLNGRLPGWDDLPRLRFTDMVFSEAMRLYPPAWGIGRRAIEDYQVGDFKIPAGSIILTCPYVVHRDPRWFPEPEKFHPDRWLPDHVAERPKFSYFPFGGGARVCIGERFAKMEGVLLLTAIAQQWRFRMVPGYPVETKALITLRPKFGMQMTPELHGDAPSVPALPSAAGKRQVST
jgi:cytochrome P450